jgi:hypothetical protein
VQILSDEQTRLLFFVEACNSSGYQPTVEEVTLWLDSPTRRGPESRWSQNMSKAFSSLSISGLADFAGIPGTGETFIEHAVRLKWISGSDRLFVSRLGGALLSATARVVAAQAETDFVVLDRDDPLAYFTLVGRLAGFGQATLIDPYLRLDQLHDLAVHTDVSRILISKQQKNSKAERAAISTYLGSDAVPRPIEVRATSDNDVHDRMILAADGNLHLLGYSLNGIQKGTASTVLVQLPAEACTAQTLKIEHWWAQAEPVTAAQPPVTSDSA